MIDVPVSSDNPESLWMATATERVDTPVLESNHSVEVTIAGAYMKPRDRGYEVFAPDMSMYTLGGGGVHCLCQALKRDPFQV